jgi:hypothetical protein
LSQSSFCLNFGSSQVNHSERFSSVFLINDSIGGIDLLVWTTGLYRSVKNVDWPAPWRFSQIYLTEGQRFSVSLP